MNKRQITSLFRKVVAKIGTEKDIDKLEDILNSFNLKADCFGFGDNETHLSYYLGEYNGTLTKKELVKNDSYFRSLKDILKKDIYLEVYKEKEQINLCTSINVEYRVDYGTETQTLCLNEINL